MEKKNRPLAPHLTIYKPQITSIVSIFHRISGSTLALSFICLIFFVYFDIVFSEFFLCYNEVFILQIYFYWLFISLANFISVLISFHFFNGIRHLIWDLAIGLDAKNVSTTGLLVLSITTIILFSILL
uniref:Succinate:cytochrome c oxidoreductase subunit 3 n=1 Tax=Chroomonas placoidea TaxID=173977 RepID=A0A2P1G7Z8_9CRYP|nr:succinate:cytochrome c oxidoreductase subunit 3 [Chroomonas placoidea]AVM81088.1 succinate:cytochrome c oxidoreductase subunit 3 [Chroomonas placoidea]